MQLNYFVVLASALVPILVGFIWYSPKLFGNAWMLAAGISEEKVKGANMPRIFGLTILFSIFIAFAMSSIAVQQVHVAALLGTQPDFTAPDSESSAMLTRFMELYGKSYRTFGHGAFHGLLAGISIVLPIIGINAVFERKGFKYVAINTGYWTVSLILMGGIISAFA